MTYLIDTNVLLWSLENSPKLSKKAREAITNSENEIYVSIASIWEIAIKLSIGKLDLAFTLDDIIEEIDYLGFIILPISLDALREVRTMPFHHKDPFDRLIIGQAQVGKIVVISSDQKFMSYNIKIIW